MVLEILREILIPILVFIVGSIVVARSQARKRKLEQALWIHFEDIKQEVIDHLVQMTGNLAISNDRLKYGNYSSIYSQYPFEQGNYYICFKAHFPEEARQWERFNRRALAICQKYEPLKEIAGRLHELGGMQVHQRPENWTGEHEKCEQSYRDMHSDLRNDTTHLIDNCKAFSLRLSSMVESISKYRMGREFKKTKTCPICKKL